MRDLIEGRLADMSQEIEALHVEREAMIRRDRDIEIRLHQLVGAVFEMQKLIAHLDHQQAAQTSLEQPIVPVEQPEADQQADQKSSQT
jgi:hypothetical protein